MSKIYDKPALLEWLSAVERQAAGKQGSIRIQLDPDSLQLFIDAGASSFAEKMDVYEEKNRPVKIIAQVAVSDWRIAMRKVREFVLALPETRRYLTV